KTIPAEGTDGGRPKFPEDWVMTFDDINLPNTDADDPENYEIVKSLSLLNPATKNDEPGPNDPELHYVRYRIKRASQGIGAQLPNGKFPKAVKHVKRQWELTNQFGTITVDSIKVAGLMVPTAKAESGTAAPPPTDATHFKCYKVKPAKDTVTEQTPTGQGRKFDRSIQALFQDQFDDCATDLSFAGTAAAGKCLYRFLKPLELCNPVIKSEVVPPRETKATIDGSTPTAADSLLCYKIKVASKIRSTTVAALVGQSEGSRIVPAQTRHRRRLNISIAPGNRFPAPSRLDTKKAEMACIPTTVGVISPLP
ncbi:MAG: hypothetical protein ACE5I7_00005, partial [Candidatus Binatia bacterium]